ncbi:MAG: hypothetical protein A2632_00725 [Candidatus Pacebacteria bacterium RIFCSPHIGHO2_01_FULL_46_16]|nr:MAG: hypothetical protein A2632_00725 [Candidatus Pacebacteria bacterium RIFCSPHIGHO2_01_FULL_46_16]OGJ38678.1 MAG: hypothetical protein A3A82_03035 [Candidatus Pacebacteria bacterium RIFCSPLOWO2_01_FULL_47_12]
MPDGQQQDPLKALEDLIAQRTAGAAAPPADASSAEPAVIVPPRIDTDALLAAAKARDEVDIAKQRQKFEELKQTSPQSQAATEQKAAATADQVVADEFSDAYQIRQIDHTTIPSEEIQ